MTVRELITYLNRLDPDLRVVVPHSSNHERFLDIWKPMVEPVYDHVAMKTKLTLRWNTTAVCEEKDIYDVAIIR